jgi:PII-like signaling protein
MKLFAEARLLRIFIGESDKFDGRPLYQAIVERAHTHGLAGATVLRGYLGFGANSRIHSARIMRLSADLPMVIEIVDEPERITAFAAELDGLIREGLVTMERVEVVIYRHDETERS